MNNSLHQTLLRLSRGKSLLGLTYTFLLLANYAKENIDQFQSDHKMERLFSEALKEIKHKWPEFGSMPEGYLLQSDENTTLELIALIRSLNNEYGMIEPQIRTLVSHYSKRMALSHTPENLTSLITSIIALYKSRYQLNSFYDFNARSGDLISSISDLDLNKQTSFYLEEANPLMYQIGLMLFNLSDKTNIDFSNVNSLIDSKMIKNQLKVDCVVSYPRLSILLNDFESDTHKPFLQAPINHLDKINSPEALYTQLSTHCLSDNGIAITIVADGFLSRHGYDKKLRDYLIRKNLVEAVIALPNNLYPGTTLSTSIIVLNKNRKNKTEIRLINLAKHNIDQEAINTACEFLNSDNSENSDFAIKTSTDTIIKNSTSLRPIDYIEQAPLSKKPCLHVSEIKLDKCHQEYIEAYKKWRDC